MRVEFRLNFFIVVQQEKKNRRGFSTRCWDLLFKYLLFKCLNSFLPPLQVIQDVVNDTEDNLQSNARIVRKVHAAALDDILDITVSYTTTYHQWGSDFCLVAGAVIELQTGGLIFW